MLDIGEDYNGSIRSKLKNALFSGVFSKQRPSDNLAHIAQFALRDAFALAKYRAKIEHKRVLQNELGKRVLAALVKSGVLWTDPKFYHVAPEKCDAELGVSWHDLRHYKTSPKLEKFLKEIK